MAGKRTVIRTLDLGADKQAPCLPLEKEENPALGLRAIRLCLTRRDLFKTQLRAILRAAAFGKTAILLPMIVSGRSGRSRPFWRNAAPNWEAGASPSAKRSSAL
jgi:phosphotransferase system enzyme I (PtsI)